MPSTITTYYSFQPATKARSSQVNTNFSNYRGDLLPINENTASASNNTHYLGGSDHYWAGAYVGQIDFITSTTTATLVLKGDTSATLGAFLFQVEGSTVAKIEPSRLTLLGSTTTVNPIFNISTTNTTGAMDLLFGSSTITSWSSSGLKPAGIDVGIFTTTGAPIGGYLVTGATTLASLSTLSTTGQTLTSGRITTRGAGIVNVNIIGDMSSDDGTGNDHAFLVELYRGATITALSLISTSIVATTRAEGTSTTVNYHGGHISCIAYDSGYSSGEVVYVSMIKSAISPTTTLAVTFSITASVFIKEL